MHTIQFQKSKYFIQHDGTVLRVLKPTVIKGQQYFNLIIDGKMKRINRKKLEQFYTDSFIKSE